jgi:DNA-binding NtrC family response regulator
MQTILLVEDDRLIRHTLLTYLRDLGHEVEAVDDGQAGLDRLLQGGIDLCLLDMGLPVLEGMEVLSRYKQRAPQPDHASFVIISARDDMHSTIEAVRLGAYDYLLKPLDLDRLQLTIARALEQRATSRALSRFMAQARASVGEMVGRSEGIRGVFKAVGAVAPTKAAVLIRGESGTGKELVARAIHAASLDAGEPFVAVNCSAFARELLESELFGHVRGAFTGATGDRAGRLESAGKGTLFLDEIGELPPELQVKLLRVLQERTYERVGDSRPQRLEARVLAATHRDLGRMVRAGTFREDLYYRLRVVEITVPPLRDRREDLPVLVDELLGRINRNLRTNVRYISQDAMDLLLEHPWPGNVRELENALTGACVLAKGDVITLQHLPTLTSPDELGDALGPASSAAPIPQGNTPATAPLSPPATDPTPLLPLREIERQHVARVLEHTGWNKRRACAILAITRPTLDRKIKDFSLIRPGEVP